MTTWMRFVRSPGFPVALSAAALFFLSAVCALPTIPLRHRYLGGGPIREAILNRLFLPILPDDWAIAIVQWYQGAAPLQEWFVAIGILAPYTLALVPLATLIQAVLPRPP